MVYTIVLAPKNVLVPNPNGISGPASVICVKDQNVSFLIDYRNNMNR